MPAEGLPCVYGPFTAVLKGPVRCSVHKKNGLPKEAVQKRAKDGKNKIALVAYLKLKPIALAESGPK